MADGNFGSASEPALDPEGNPIIERDERMWGMFCHLAALAGYVGIPFGNVIGPLAVWLIKKEDYPFVDDQGKESINFQITIIIALLVALFLAFFVIGFLLVPAVVIFGLVMTIIAAVQANEGKFYRFPFAIRLLK